MDAPQPRVRSMHLLRRNPSELVPATAIVNFPADRVSQVEEQWQPAREKIKRSLDSQAQQRRQRYASERARSEGRTSETRNYPARVLEHGHWNWRIKIDAFDPEHFCVVAVEADGQVEGLMVIARRQRRSKYNEIGDEPQQALLYVEFIETAPWNLKLPGLQEPRYTGVGTVLIGEAIRESFANNCEGRIGLHSLAQSEKFYHENCNMIWVERDENYGLSYWV